VRFAFDAHEKDVSSSNNIAATNATKTIEDPSANADDLFHASGEASSYPAISSLTVAGAVVYPELEELENSPLSNPEGHLSEFLKLLDKNEADFWMRQFNALTGMRRLVLNHPDVFTSAIMRRSTALVCTFVRACVCVCVSVCVCVCVCV
jgi:hypothetical protein